jgi:uncharacterized RDD family membrane protein YckC
MTDAIPAAGAPEPTALYSTFPRRLNALSVDSVVLIGVSIAVFMAAPLLENMPTGRVALDLGWWIGLLLYEPLLVWRWGGTIGHRAFNLRVVDNATGGNVSFLTALGRYAGKMFLGFVSFFSMGFTRRRQAIHDYITDSSVRIHDAARALPHHYTVGPA